MAHTSRHTASTPGDTRNSQGTVFIDGEPATSIRPIYKTMQPVASHRLPGCSRVTWAQNCEVVTSGRGCLDDMLDSPQLSDCQHDDEVLQVPRALKLLHESTAAEVDKTAPMKCQFRSIPTDRDMGPARHELSSSIARVEAVCRDV